MALIFAPGLVACTLLPWSSLTSGGPDASSDGFVEASLPDADAGGIADGSAEGGVPGNILPDPSFESVSVGCGAWSGFNSVVAIADEGHTGARSCKVCMAGVGNGSVYTEPKVDGKKGQRAVWSGWYKVPATGAAAEVPGTQIDLVDNLGDGGTHTDFGQLLSPSGTWKPFSVTSSAAPNAFDEVGLNAVVHSPDGGLACVLFDDMTLVIAN